MCKSYLALGIESQSRSYEAQVATTSVVFLRYMMIAESVRLEHDEKTWGEIFFRFCDEIKDIEYAKAVKLLIDTMVDILRKSPVLHKAFSESHERAVMSAACAINLEPSARRSEAIYQRWDKQDQWEMRTKSLD